MAGFSQGPTTGQSATPDMFSTNSFYYQAWASDPSVFAVKAQGFFNGLRNSRVQAGTISNDPNYTDLMYFQGAVRKLGLSKGVSPLGQLDTEDYTAMAKVVKEGYLGKQDWISVLEGYAQSPYLKLNSSGFSKTVSTALKNIDKTDAQSILNKAYYENFGVYPAAKQIANFQAAYNKEAQRQLAKTTTTTTSGAGGLTTSKTTTTGEGFTQAEADQFLAQYLKDNYKITGKEVGGKAKTVVEQLMRVYDDNLLDRPPAEEILAFAADVIGTGDEEMQSQKLATQLQTIRNTASKFYPGAMDTLTAGTDIKTIATPMITNFNNTLGTSIKINDDRAKLMLNYFDGKTTRVMNAAEQQKFIESQPEYQTSDAGRAKWANIAQAFENGLR